jgi:hypothetical protein
MDAVSGYDLAPRTRRGTPRSPTWRSARRPPSRAGSRGRVGVGSLLTRELLAGEVDYTLMDELVVEYIVRNHGEQARARLRFGSTPLVKRALFLAIRRSLPEAGSIIDAFNAELRKPQSGAADTTEVVVCVTQHRRTGWRVTGRGNPRFRSTDGRP